MSTQLHDVDPIETREWLDALSSVLEYEGSERAQYLLENLVKYGRRNGVRMPHGTTTPYVNTIAKSDEKPIPGDQAIEHRVRLSAGTRQPSYCVPVRKIWNWADTSHLSNLRPPCTKSVSTISGKPKAKVRKAIWCSSKATPHRVCMPAPLLKAV